MKTQAAAAPIVKWAGGKSRLLPELARRAPATFGRYYEPFCGGAALFFHLAPSRAVLSDLNSDLIAAYSAIRGDVEAVIRGLRRHATAHSKCHYYSTRDRWNTGRVKGPAARAAALIYLNKTCFNGLWRVNRGGAFNVPMGRYANPLICAPDKLRAASLVLARAELRCIDYRAVVAEAVRGDFVYFDPPYDPMSPTASFTSYTAGKFGVDDQRTLAQCARELVERGCYVMLSNSDTLFIRALYRDFRIARVKCARSINADAKSRGAVNELVITGGGREVGRP